MREVSFSLRAMFSISSCRLRGRASAAAAGLLVAAGLVLIAPSAQAQRRGAREVPPAVSLKRYAACIIGEREAVSRAILASPAASPEEAVCARRLNDRRCFARGGFSMCYDTRQVRGAIAEELYARDSQSRRHTPSTEPLPVSVPREDLDGAALALAFGQCIAGAAPSGADSVLDAAVDSTEEGAALARLRPVMAGCLPSSRQITIDRLQVRHLLAEARYARLHGLLPPAADTAADASSMDEIR